jgi:FixJ family two-component response regulator
MQAGAFHVIQKPVIQQEIISCLEAALAWSRNLRKTQKESVEIWIAMRKLTLREAEILELLVDGLSSRDIGEKLTISRFTVDHHRARILSKLEVPTLSKLTSCVARAKALFGTKDFQNVMPPHLA